MLTTILFIGVILFVFITIGRVFGPVFYNPSPAYFHDQLPDLRLADWSPALREYHLEKLEEQRKVRELIEEDVARCNAQIAWESAQDEAEIAKRVEAWKNGTPHQEMPEVRRTGRTNEMSKMSRLTRILKEEFKDGP